QAYRELWAGRPVARGDREMSLSELRQQISLRPDQQRRLAMTFHTRFSISTAPIMLATLGLVMVRSHRRKWVVVLIGSGVCLVYWVLLLVAEHAGIYTMLPVFILAWLPNIACALLASGLAWRGLRPAS